jgi:hypothetical protein
MLLISRLRCAGGTIIRRVKAVTACMTTLPQGNYHRRGRCRYLVRNNPVSGPLKSAATADRRSAAAVTAPDIAFRPSKFSRFAYFCLSFVGL